MTHEERKLTKIVEELTLYFFAVGADHIRSDIDRKKAETVITFHANFQPDCKAELRNLDKYLNGVKNDGIEDIYWELAGSGDPGESSQLLLIGMMIDRADIRLDEDRIQLTLYKKPL
ncbi:MAG: hypothetical protein LBQ15_13345 [Clostridium sp.]|jgi:hypothetical protein|nr:hypothetical protein [Clostridium sp.]